jgi:hypothetical protein
MPEEVNDRERVLRTLDDAVNDAAGYLAEVDQDLHGGHQTAREVLSHLVYWHREYVTITKAMLDGCQPPLRDGTFAQLNAEATKEFAGQTMADLAYTLLTLQETFLTQLRSLPDWSANFPTKQDGRHKCVTDRVSGIESHFRGHSRRLRRAERLGEAWVRAYYPDQE